MSMAQPNFKTSLSLCSNDLLAFYFKTVSVIELMGLLDTRRGWGGGGVLPVIPNAIYGEAPPERGIFFRLQVSIGSVKGPKRLSDEFLWLYKVEKTFYFCD